MTHQSSQPQAHRRRHLRRSRITAIVVGACAAVGVACGSEAPAPATPGEPREIVSRLVERRDASRPPEPTTLVVRDVHAFPVQTSVVSKQPTATLDDETRTLLAGHERSLLKVLDPVALDDRGHLVMAVDLWFELLAADEIVVAPVVLVDGAWRSLAPQRLPVVRRGKRRVVDLDVAVPGGAPGLETRTTIEGIRPPGQATTSVASEPFSIPADARLEFGFGVLGPAQGMGAVEFRIESCADASCEAIFRETLDPATPTGRGWQDRVVSLAASTAPRSLRFVTERGEGAFSLPIWSDPVVTAPAAASPRPSFILVSIDTLRRDHLDVYGYPRETAPFLRRLMRERGVVFDDLVAEAATTDPSHMSLFTSLPALVHGVQRQQEALQVPVTTLAEQLRTHGYRTAAFTENGPLARERGFGIGFDVYAENKSIDLVNPTGHVEKTLAQGRAWLERNAELPFFLFLHTFQVHAPYAPPEHLRTLFTDAPAHPASVAAADRSRRARLVNDYDREIRFVDEQLEALYAWAAARGIAEDTWWIFLSDHGEEFFEHGELGHSTLPHGEVLRVPLLVAGPTGRPGARDASPLHHVDLMPTLLDLAGMAVPDGLVGTSFAGRLREPSEESAARPRFSATWMLPAGLRAPAHSVERGPRKLIRYRDADGTKERLVDPRQDEGVDLAAQEQGEREALAALLDAHLAEAGADREARGPADRAPGEPIPLDPEREAKLRALGYID